MELVFNNKLLPQNRVEVRCPDRERGTNFVYKHAAQGSGSTAQAHSLARRAGRLILSQCLISQEWFSLWKSPERNDEGHALSHEADRIPAWWNQRLSQ
jgi:hypothetical protein